MAQNFNMNMQAMIEGNALAGPAPYSVRKTGPLSPLGEKFSETENSSSETSKTSSEKSEHLSSEMLDDSEEDEFGVNDEHFNFNDFKYPKVKLDDIETPALMSKLFPEKYGINREEPTRTIDELASMYMEGADASLLA